MVRIRCMVRNKKMQRLIWFTVAFVLVISCLIFVSGTDIFAASAPSATGKVTTSGSAYLRKSTSTKTSKVKSLNKGKKFTISFEKYVSKKSTSRKYIWYYTSYKGYMRADLASISYKSKKAKTTDTLNARAGAGKGFKIKKTFKKGATINVVLKAKDSSNKTWYKIKYGSKYYYVLSSYVKFTTSSKVTSYKKTGKTTTSVNARSGAGTKYNLKKTYAKGKTLSIVGKITVSKTLWYKLSNGYYVIGKYVKITTSSSASKLTAMNKTAVITDYVNARSGAGTKYSIKKIYSTGTKVTVKGKITVSGKVWYKLSNGYYVIGDYISFNVSSTALTTTSSSVAGFPSSYNKYLSALKSKHPNWKFEAVNTGLDWNTALSKMTESDSNTIQSPPYGLSYLDVGEGSFNFLTNSYKVKDGSNWYRASKKAVAYYMDPRNWLTDNSVFMFEDHTYNSTYQTTAVVKKVLSNNNALKGAASSFVAAGKKYDINPVYLASKSYSELGAYTSMINGHSFKYGGKTFSKCYNAFNIGAYDSSSGNAATSGLVYANGGYYGKYTSYGRKWSSLSKAIYGGAAYIAEDFVQNNQGTGYLEHFNVLNGISNVGTHVYMTAVFAPNSMAYPVYSQYQSYGIHNEKIVFKIPVYNNMPSSPCAKPGSGNNNNYLRSLNFTYGSSKKNLIICSSAYISSMYKTSFSATVANSVKSVKINASKYDSGASVTSGTGTKSLKVGVNTFYVKCKSSSGLTRTYKISITRK